MKRLRSWRLPTVIALTVGLVLVVHTAIAIVTTQSGKSIDSVKITGSNNVTTTTSTTFANLSTIAMSIPSGHTAFFIVRFTAESACNGDTIGDGCVLRFTWNNSSMQPDTGTDFFFDSVETPGTECPAIAVTQAGAPKAGTLVTTQSCGWQGHAAQRNSAILSGGHTYYLHVLWAIVGSGADLFWLDDWSFSVERVMVS